MSRAARKSVIVMMYDGGLGYAEATNLIKQLNYGAAPKEKDKLNGKYQDFTVIVGDLGMYSYDRPAWTYWNAFANQLVMEGYTKEQALEILKSKHMRWMLDVEGEDKIERAAERACVAYLKVNRSSIDQMLKDEYK